MATAEFSKFAGILSAALSQHHPSGFEIAQYQTFVHVYIFHFCVVIKLKTFQRLDHVDVTLKNMVICPYLYFNCIGSE